MSLHHDSNPAFEVGEFPTSYAVVTLAIYAVGMGLVILGHRVGAGRRARRTPVAAGSAAGEVVAAGAVLLSRGDLPGPDPAT